ncbi:glycoside hydrolase family 97 protein [Flavobacterium sp. CF136]|uniref:glycoside hydrolase family 97 protein n=1 Tax=Flavobacterium sp. (strain CF136) TaxID=1144313 RepID=UPI000271C1F8|nr:glycoside hydrolase family 97 protein [Flavobacterium sp. CF136]EJL59753.1 Glycoside hydrolase 97 [Flavobacterium sp. CF136]
MKIIRFYLLGLLLCSVTIQAQSILQETVQKLKSPNGFYEFTFYQKQINNSDKQMYYTLFYKGKPVVLESELGVLIENQTFESALAVPNDTCKVWGENLNFTGILRNAVDETWKPVYGENSIIRNNYNELTISFRKGEIPKEKSGDGYDKNKSYFMNVIVRAYDGGVAVRYHFPEPSNGLFLHIIGEQTQFTMPEGTLAYYEPWAQGPFSLLPLKDWKGQSERPLTMKLTNGLTVAIAEAQMTDYARMKFTLNTTKPNTLQATIYSSVDVIPAYSTPWRVIMAGEKSTDLIENKEIILNLNPENQLKEVSWIKPGKVIRVAKMTQADAKKCIDFAAERSLQYVHLDAGWYGPEMKMSSDAATVSNTKDLNIPELTAYAASKGIGLWVYVNQRALIQQLDSILPLYKKWGIKGIKFGFVQVGNQRWTTWLHEAVKKCAEYGFMVDIHDEYRPTGFSRTYPNLMTQEGIRGNEEMPDADHNTILPFTRFLAGPADYTICYYRKDIKNTHAHQLALSLVYYSPIQFLYWYDQPSAYQGEPEIEFFDKVKTVWDETKVLDGQVGEYITVARKTGKDWFVGAITNNQTRKITVPTTFLEKGKKYVVKSFQDDDTIQTRTKVAVKEQKIKGGDVLAFDLKASGGVALIFSEVKKN